MYKFSDISESEVPGEGKRMTKGRGCYVNTTTGIIIVLLAIAISVGVGLIVHFAEKRTLECNFPNIPTYGGSSMVQGQSRGTQHQQTVTTLKSTTVEPSAGSTPGAVQTASVTPESTPPMRKDIRLPKALKPIHYILKVTPHMYGSDPSKFTFSGHVKIEMNCSEPTTNVTLHINQLNVSSIRFGSASVSSSARYQSHKEDRDRQLLIIQLDKPTRTGETYSAEMDFVGALKNDLKGLYLSSFEQGGKTVYAAVTQFEPTDARKAFPCFDEPEFKATFEVTLVRMKNLKAVSNMPKTNSVPVGNDMVEDHFETSKFMSTYLLAFVVGDFDFVAANTSHGLLYSAWATRDSVDQTKTALNVGLKTIVNYENYFGIDFPLPKQDMIAVPELSFGAMENWGLITYRETAMLYMPNTSAQLSLQRVTQVITHELAHQWFGDLVTLRWWDDLWLNEGFATFVEYMGADLIHPDWKMFEQFVVHEVHDAFEFDGLVTSHPIYVPVNNPDEINEIFDRISYAKGGAVIRMMKFVLGDDTFKKGIQLYLEMHQYRNAFHDDLWQALSDQSLKDGQNVNVKQIMDTWILQMNYPVVRVTALNNRISLRQSRFLSAPDATDPGKYASPYGYKWEVPFTYTTSNTLKYNVTETTVHWLNDEYAEINHTGVQNESWILGNIQQFGFYRVTYEDNNWLALINQLKRGHQSIHAINRAQMINDAWSLARASQLSTKIALGTLEYLKNELDYIPWVAAQRQLDYLDRMLSRTELYGLFSKFMKSVLMNPFNHYGLEDSNSSHIETFTRRDIMKLACSYGITDCITKSTYLFKQWMERPSSNLIDPDVRDTVYCTAISNGGSDEWEFAFEQYKLTKAASEKVTLMKALACTKSTWLLNRYLNIAVTPTEIRKQDAASVIVYISQNPIGHAITWDFVRANWNYLLNEYGKGLNALTHLISGITAGFNTEFELSQLISFKAKNPYLGTGTRALQQAIEKTQTNIKWLSQNRQTISMWLNTVIKSKAKDRLTDIRLPLHLVPISYDLTIQPNMYSGDSENFTFDGHVKIYMDAKQSGSNVTLHTNKLLIHENSIKFTRQDGIKGGPIYTGERTHDDERQFEIFSLDQDIRVGEKYYIEMNFTGPLKGDLAGLYLSQYERGNETV